jgi:hypothetical protein
MESLIDEAWRLYIQTPDPSVVRPAIPILYFGDFDRYVKSPLKIITVALNPSHREFPESDRFERFRPAQCIDVDNLEQFAVDAYVAALNGYFRGRPYMQWFSWFEHVLLGLGASYSDGEESTVIHNDLCSPLATNPTWSKLGREKNLLATDGMALWHLLVDHLAPDVIIISVARHYRDQIEFADTFGWQTLVTVSRRDPSKRPFHALMQRANLPNGKETLLVFGPAAQQPFATLTQADRQAVGRKAREGLFGG